MHINLQGSTQPTHLSLPHAESRAAETAAIVAMAVEWPAVAADCSCAARERTGGSVEVATREKAWMLLASGAAAEAAVAALAAAALAAAVYTLAAAAAAATAAADRLLETSSAGEAPAALPCSATMAPDGGPMACGCSACGRGGGLVLERACTKRGSAAMASASDSTSCALRRTSRRLASHASEVVTSVRRCRRYRLRDCSGSSKKAKVVSCAKGNCRSQVS
jgi:hypothetical protein